MNFKEAYKSATDEIHGDKALLHAILNGEAESKKRFGFSLRPVYSVAVAASLVITCTALYFKNGFEDVVFFNGPSKNTTVQKSGISFKNETNSLLKLPFSNELSKSVTVTSLRSDITG